MRQNIEILWRNYQKVKLYAAMRGDFNFDHDFMAYDAYVTGKADTLTQLIEGRLRGIGLSKIEEVKFRKGERTAARKAYALAQGGHSVKREGPMHFVGIEGKVGMENFKATYSDERRSSVETPFGDETDNSEVF